MNPIDKSDGVNASERFLQRLCEGTLLSLWSYPGVFRDQGRQGGIGDGKEVCDLLVVFENHVIIFSDKACQFPNTGNLGLDWCRWYKRAVLCAAKQLGGAERWIREHPDRLFLDRACTKPFPLMIPRADQIIFHRVVVAHGASGPCQELLGGIGSLMIAPALRDEQHWSDPGSARPFQIGLVDSKLGYIHVFDDSTVEIVLRTVDTVSDFVAYLTRKEAFIASGRLGFAAGEDDLLAYYLSKVDEHGKHDFVVPEDVTDFFLDEGFWQDFVGSEQRARQQAADQVSYFWDALIEAFSTHIIHNTQYWSNVGEADGVDAVVRFLAREDRTRRRLLASKLIEVIDTTPRNFRRIGIVWSQNPDETCFVFLVFPVPDHITYERYRDVRREYLAMCCQIAKARLPSARHIVGIATETVPWERDGSSEDAIYLDAQDWSDEAQADALRFSEEFGILTNPEAYHISIREYPDDEAGYLERQ